MKDDSTLKFLRAYYPNEIGIYERFPLREKKAYRTMINNAKRLPGLLAYSKIKSPSEFVLEYQPAGEATSWSAIASKLNISVAQAKKAYETGMAKLKARFGADLREILLEWMETERD